MKRGFDYMGNLGVLAQGLSEPEIAAKLAQVSPQAKEQTKRWLDELNARGKASQPKVGATEEKLIAARRMVDRGEAANVQEALGILQTAGVLPGGPKQLAPIEVKLKESQIKANEARAGLANAKAGGGGRPAAAGAGVKSAALGGAAAPADKDEAIDFWARAVIAGDKDWQVGIGRSKTGAQLIEAVKRRVPQLAKQMGLEPQDIGTTRAESAALGATMKDLTKRAEAVELFASKVDKDMKTFDNLLDNASTRLPAADQQAHQRAAPAVLRRRTGATRPGGQAGRCRVRAPDHRRHAVGGAVARRRGRGRQETHQRRHAAQAGTRRHADHAPGDAERQGGGSRVRAAHQGSHAGPGSWA